MATLGGRFFEATVVDTTGMPRWNIVTTATDYAASSFDFVVSTAANITVALPALGTFGPGDQIGIMADTEGGGGPPNPAAVGITTPAGVTFCGNSGTFHDVLATRSYAANPALVLIAISTTDWAIMPTVLAGGPPAVPFNELDFGLFLQGPLYAGLSGFNAGNVTVGDDTELVVPMSGTGANSVTFQTTAAHWMVTVVVNTPAAAGNVALLAGVGQTYAGPAALAPGHGAVFLTLGGLTICAGTF